MMAGGLSTPKPATPEVQAIAEQVKAQLEAKVNQSCPIYEAVSYCLQVVAGTNYFIKVHVGPGEKDFAHLRVFEALPVYGGQVELAGFQLGKTRDEPIAYF
ncbi:leukocyte cysteine proteinase inhibitor 1 [Anolis carolinensis]|uniref:Cystatin domain-containing protein n=1 Tax=Anolis carolinensis TaxID=28377 RepID=A0A803U094_ANOCA|nr:PREDICTED: leukocyte cysteine proteinase inhibitor 1 [Anolis carolinensis]|eukprot:XP_008122005.1 PREDICTED: leukocyte cysteine proteinase inhibitor 1 [Anolis carolinensis]